MCSVAPSLLREDTRKWEQQHTPEALHAETSALFFWTSYTLPLTEESESRSNSSESRIESCWYSWSVLIRSNS